MPPNWQLQQPCPYPHVPPLAYNMAKVFYTWFTKLTFLKFGFKLILSQLLENKPQIIFMLMFNSTKHKYIIQVHKHKFTNVLAHDTIYQPLEG